ncbi:MAG: aquaporin [Actinomycetota bacterium]|nr:aquaporin [Actinomycetota bacterium]
MKASLDARKLAAEVLGTALLVFFAVGTATLSFGFKLAGASMSAGVVTTALAFGLVLLALVYAIGPVSGCHVNPAVTMGFVASRRMDIGEAIGYWIAQFVGGAIGAVVLWGVFHGSNMYSRDKVGLGTDGWGKHSMINLGAGGAFIAEVILTFLFVLVVLAATSHASSAGFAGLAIGMALTVVHLVGIPLTGTSVNPARSLGPALVVGGDALKQVWLFIVAPLVGGVLAALVHQFVIVGGVAKEPEVAGAVRPSDVDRP